MALMTELKRRRVFRVAAVYGVTAWVITEVSATVLPALHLPEQLITIIVVLLIAGFPIAMVLAWIFDIDPDGIHRTESPPEVAAAVRTAPARLIYTGLIVAATAALAALFFWRLGATEARPLDSIAVLPFANMSSAPGSDYFSDGISEELLNLLARVPGLKVAARTSSFAFKGQDTDIREIGTRLGVATVLEGSVRWSDDREQVRITAQLIDAASGYHLWSDNWDRRLEDIFAVQDEIAQAIVTALEIELAGGDARQPLPGAAPPTQDVEAYTLYLRGRALWKKRGLEGIEQSIDLFQAALARDPGFARAYSNLAAAYVLVPSYGIDASGSAAARVTPEDASRFFDLASEAALTALTIDESLAEAHAVLARISDDRWAWSDAQTGFFFATSLDPAEPIAHHWYSLHLRTVGRHLDALAEARLAAQLDPESAVIVANLATTLAAAGFDDEARTTLARAEQLGFMRHDAAPAGGHDLPHLLDRTDAAGLDEAFELARQLAAERRLPLDTMWQPQLQAFRSDPRFGALMRDVGLTDYWRRYGWADACTGEATCG